MERNIDIDLVIPMVFPHDPEWQREYRRYQSGDATRNARWRSWGTEELLIQCVIKWMPWIRHIHLLLASESQEQPWMTEMTARSQQIIIHYHKDFIPEQYLPCYTSCCIEMFLHRIPGLSEYFIYGNDDMFPLSPLDPEDFFRTKEAHKPVLPCQKLREKIFPKSPNIFQQKCLNQQNMIAKPFGKHFTKTLLRNGHSMAPMLKSVCEAVWLRHGEEIKRYLSPIKRDKHSYSQYVYVLYQHFAGLYIEHQPRVQYIGRETPTSSLATIIRDPEAGIVCFNDNEHISDWEKRAEIVLKETSKKLKEGSRKMTVLPKYVPLACIVHYNTPKLTKAAVLSLWKHTPGVRVTVFDNSDKLPISGCEQWKELLDNPLVTIIDNTQGQYIDFEAWLQTFLDREPSPGNNYGSAKHCRSVQWLCDHIDEPFVLMDSDVLVKNDVSELWQHSDCIWVGEIGENVKRRFGYDFKKVQPFLCYLNVPMMREYGIRYFNAEWMWNLTSKKPNHRYDTGAWFYKAVKETILPTWEIRLNDYILHLGHGSWRDKKPMEWVRMHRGLWK